jgi:hypothetical protein
MVLVSVSLAPSSVTDCPRSSLDMFFALDWLQRTIDDVFPRGEDAPSPHPVAPQPQYFGLLFFMPPALRTFFCLSEAVLQIP